MRGTQGPDGSVGMDERGVATFGPEPHRGSARRGLSRRALLGTGALGAGAAGYAYLALSGPGSPGHAGDRAVAGTSGPGPLLVPASASLASGSCLNIIAHPDDDLFFMNPDVMRNILAGCPVVTAVLTAAPSDGRNIDVDAPNRDATPVDIPGYVEARHNGLRASYALMATGDAESAWQRQTVEITPGVSVELDVLTARPHVHLYFFNVYQARGASEHDVDGSDASAHGVSKFGASPTGMLWSGTTDYVTTLVSAHGTVREVQRFGRAQLAASLLALLEAYRPTVLRGMDPDPAHDPGQRGYVTSDHPDHTAVAQFTLGALAEYRQNVAAAPVVEHFHAYDNRFWPYNLSISEHAVKRRILLTYSGQDGRPCPDRSCGDFQLGPEPDRSTHIFSTAYRYAQSTGWLRLRSDGRLEAFAVLGGEVAYWTETKPGGGQWSGPTLIDGGWVNPALSVAAEAGGRTHLFAQRRTVQTDGNPVLEIVWAVRETPTATFGSWASLGNPDAADSDIRRQRELGIPAAAVDGTGRVHVFVRGFEQALHHATLDPGARSWTGWTELQHTGLAQDCPTVLATRTGRIEAYAPGKKSVYRWYQRVPGGELYADEALHTTPVAVGGLNAVEIARDRVCLVYRQAHTALVLTYEQSEALGGWPHTPRVLGGHLGTGPVAALQGRTGAGVSAILTMHRNAIGTPTFGIPDATAESVTWTDAPVAFSGTPGLCSDAEGRTVAAAVGLDGRLWVSRQQTEVLESPFGPWQAYGS